MAASPYLDISQWMSAITAKLNKMQLEQKYRLIDNPTAIFYVKTRDNIGKLEKQNCINHVVACVPAASDA